MRSLAYWVLSALLQCAIGLSALLPAAAQAAGTPAADGKHTVLVMGDSLSAGYGMAASQGWVALLGQRLEQDHPGWTVVNASISGETTAGGSARIVPALMLHRPDVVVIALGANDGLRGLPLRQMRRNLARMIGAAQYTGANVLLVGMRLPPNLGPDYTQRFEGLYRELSAFFDVPLLPFLLEPVALDRSLFQDDNLHPTPEAQPRLLEHVWPALEPLLVPAGSRTATS